MRNINLKNIHFFLLYSMLISFLSTQLACSAMLECWISGEIPLFGACEAQEDNNQLAESGEVKGVIFYKNKVVSAARIHLLTQNYSQLSDKKGAFSFTNLPVGAHLFKAEFDENQDGIIDAAALFSGHLKKEAQAKGLIGSSQDVSGLYFPQINLEKLTEATGQIRIKRADGTQQTPAEAQINVRILAYRPACYAFETSTAGLIDARCKFSELQFEEKTVSSETDKEEQQQIIARSLGVESIIGVAADGSFVLPELIPGELALVAIASDTDSKGISAIRAISKVFLGKAAQQDIEIILPELKTSLSTESVIATFEIKGENLNQSYFIFVPTGRTFPHCLPNLQIAQEKQSDYPYAVYRNTLVDGTRPSVNAPVGYFDVLFCDGQDQSAILQKQLFVPTQNITADEIRMPVRWQNDALACPTIDNGNDCNRNGIPGLPDLNNSTLQYVEDRQIWQDCAEQCSGGFEQGSFNLRTSNIFGSALPKTCELAGKTYDCDDDGDGQADVTEHILCFGINGGTDLDSDLLCDDYDPFPGCQANDASICKEKVVLTQIPQDIQRLPFCKSFTKKQSISDVYCELEALDVQCQNKYGLTCYEHQCIDNDDCNNDGTICHSLGEDVLGNKKQKRCLSSCTDQSECATDESCDGTACIPNTDPADVLLCYCDMYDDQQQPLPNPPSFLTTASAPGDQCKFFENQQNWEHCRILWQEND